MPVEKMTYKDHIVKTLSNAYQAFGTVQPGEPGSRAKSWEYCHQVFLDLHKKQYYDLTDADFDYLALNLAFFLASWGMYRGSTFLLQRDYKTHIPAVKIIMEKQYDILWDFDPTLVDEKKAKELLFHNDETSKGLYYRLEESYLRNNVIDDSFINPNEIEDEVVSQKKPNSNANKPSDTLITKILLATLACIPAFDTFFKNSCKKVEPNISQNSNGAFFDLCEFVKLYYWELQFRCKDIYHSPMKVLDIYFWRVGYGMSLVDSYNKAKTKTNSRGKDTDIANTLVNEKYFKDLQHFSAITNQYDEIDFPMGCKWKL